MFLMNVSLLHNHEENHCHTSEGNESKCTVTDEDSVCYLTLDKNARSFWLKIIVD